MNMSYCRFQNTLQDLKDCADNWGLSSDASNYERKAKEEMINLIIDLAESIQMGCMEDDDDDDEDED